MFYKPELYAPVRKLYRDTRRSEWNQSGLTCPAGGAAVVWWRWRWLEWGGQVVGEPHGAELTGEGGGRRRRGRRREAEPKQGAARSVQLHPDSCTGTSVHTCTGLRSVWSRGLTQSLFQFESVWISLVGAMWRSPPPSSSPSFFHLLLLFSLSLFTEPEPNRSSRLHLGLVPPL